MKPTIIWEYSSRGEWVLYETAQVTEIENGYQAALISHPEIFTTPPPQSTTNGSLTGWIKSMLGKGEDGQVTTAEGTIKPLKLNGTPLMIFFETMTMGRFDLHGVMNQHLKSPIRRRVLTTPTWFAQGMYLGYERFVETALPGLTSLDFESEYLSCLASDTKTTAVMSAPDHEGVVKEYWVDFVSFTQREYVKGMGLTQTDLYNDKSRIFLLRFPHKEPLRGADPDKGVVESWELYCGILNGTIRPTAPSLPPPEPTEAPEPTSSESPPEQVVEDDGKQGCGANLDGDVQPSLQQLPPTPQQTTTTTDTPLTIDSPTDQLPLSPNPTPVIIPPNPIPPSNNRAQIVYRSPDYKKSPIDQWVDDGLSKVKEFLTTRKPVTIEPIPLKMFNTAETYLDNDPPIMSLGHYLAWKRAIVDDDTRGFDWNGWIGRTREEREKEREKGGETNGNDDEVSTKTNNDQIPPINTTTTTSTTITTTTSSQSTSESIDNDPSTDELISCYICQCPMWDSEYEPFPHSQLLHLPCLHVVHTTCLRNQFSAGVGSHSGSCGQCKRQLLVLPGPQPNGPCTLNISRYLCHGYPNTMGSIVMSFDLQSGVQDNRHPKPGESFGGTVRCHTMPLCPFVTEILLPLYLKAFLYRHLFSIGYSFTRKRDGLVTFSSIHIKTNWVGGVERHGFPDENFEINSTNEITSCGVFLYHDEFLKLKEKEGEGDGKE